MKSLNTGQPRKPVNGAKAKKAKRISQSGKRTLNILGQKVFGLSIGVKYALKK
jgi:hypothetical protein